MGKSTKRKQEAWQANQPDFAGLLSKAKDAQFKKLEQIAAYNPVTLVRGYEQYAIRPIDQFVARTRSSNPTTRTMEFIRYAFNKYNPPSFLYEAWDHGDKLPYRHLFTVQEDFKLWYLALAQGRSLYKECTMGLLSKRETFYFSTCPHSMKIPEVVWYAVIRCFDETAPAALARKIASTKLHNYPVNDFWKGVARWFLKVNTSVGQMNDLLDYIYNRHRENVNWYVKDQSLPGLQRAMHSWHREMYRAQTMIRRYEKWDGIKTPDSEFERGAGRKKVHWRFHQIKTGSELAKEGSAQHHCVSVYGAACHAGRCSIWSLTTDESGHVARALTIEVSANGEIVQARGYANRAPRTEEMSVLREWAAQCGFRLKTSRL